MISFKALIMLNYRNEKKDSWFVLYHDYMNVLDCNILFLYF